LRGELTVINKTHKLIIITYYNELPTPYQVASSQDINHNFTILIGDLNTLEGV